MPSPLAHALAGFAVGWLAAPAPLTARTTSPGPANSAGSVPSSASFFGARTIPISRVSRFLQDWRWPVAFAAAGTAADVDLLIGMHSRETHSVGAGLLVFAGAWLWLRHRQAAPARVALALSLAYTSHLLLDWLGHDTTPPLGIMALWPFSSGFYLSPVSLFMGISRKYWLAAAWTQNAVSVARELVILVPVAALAFWWRGLPSGGPARAQKLQHPRPATRQRRKSTNQ